MAVDLPDSISYWLWPGDFARHGSMAAQDLTQSSPNTWLAIEIVILFAIEKGLIVPDGFGPEDVREFRAYGAVHGLGCSIVASLIVFILGGLFLDQYFDTLPLLTLIGVAVGLMASGYQLYELTLINRKDRPAGPLGRKLEAGSRKLRREHRESPDSDVQ